MVNTKRIRTKVVDSQLCKIFGQNLKHERERMGMTQILFAQKIGVTDTYLGFIERSQTAISLAKVETICKKLNKDVCSMLRRH